MKTNDLKGLFLLEKFTLPTAAMPGRMDSLGRSMMRVRRQFVGENAGGRHRLLLAGISLLSLVQESHSAVYYSSKAQWEADYEITKFAIPDSYSFPNLKAFEISQDFVVTKSSSSNFGFFAPNSYLLGDFGVATNQAIGSESYLYESTNSIVIPPLIGNGIFIFPQDQVYWWQIMGVTGLGIQFSTSSSDWSIRVEGVVYPVVSGFMGWISTVGSIAGWGASGPYASQYLYPVEIFSNSTSIPSDQLVVSSVQYGIIPEPKVGLWFLSCASLLRRRRAQRCSKFGAKVSRR